MMILWLLASILAVFCFGGWLGYMAGHADGREERAREQWDDLRRRR